MRYVTRMNICPRSNLRQGAKLCCVLMLMASCDFPNRIGSTDEYMRVCHDTSEFSVRAISRQESPAHGWVLADFDGVYLPVISTSYEIREYENKLAERDVLFRETESDDFHDWIIRVDKIGSDAWVRSVGAVYSTGYRASRSANENYLTKIFGAPAVPRSDLLALAFSTRHVHLSCSEARRQEEEPILFARRVFLSAGLQSAVVELVQSNGTQLFVAGIGNDIFLEFWKAGDPYLLTLIGMSQSEVDSWLTYISSFESEVPELSIREVLY